MDISHFNLDNYDALIFDLDGTLIDSMEQHNSAWMATLLENGVDLDLQFFEETTGLSSERIVGIINERLNMQLDPKLISQSKRAKYRASMAEVKTAPAVMDIVKAYHGKLPMGIVTGGSHPVVDILLPQLGIDHYFSALMCADDTKEGKDTAVPFDLVAQKLGVKASKCVFFDDGDAGLKGARAAGMDIIRVDLATPEVFFPVL